MTRDAKTLHIAINRIFTELINPSWYLVVGMDWFVVVVVVTHFYDVRCRLWEFVFLSLEANQKKKKPTH